ncbi:MAG TPA: mechanosensitive ion channel family protein [Phycisphaerae bacterium]|nr:mechanosensitive ion channel family protein [Phycisphaerae bacterium]
MLTLAQADSATQLTTQSTTAPAEAVEWYEKLFASNDAKQWGILLAILIATLAVGKIVSYLLSRQGKAMMDRRRMVALGMILRSLARPAALLIFGLGLQLAGTFMTLGDGLPGTPLWVWLRVCQAIIAIAAGWAIYGLVDVIEMFLTRLTSRTGTQLDDQLVPILRKALRIFVVIVVLLFIAQNIFKWNVGAMLAGLGIGGLAFALAAQDMLKNLFGSVTIFADRPFQMGDRVKIGDHDGVVEVVGLRSTRIRLLSGHLVTVPNARVADSAVENITARPYIKRVMDVTVTYDTPPQKMARAVEIIRQMLDARADHFPPDNPGRVYFHEFESFSLNIVVYYWFTPPDWWEYLQFTHEFNMELLRRFNEEGIQFAFPTRTLYVKQDSDFSAEVRTPREPR